MEHRKYSMRDVQRISQLSPNTLQELLRNNSSCFKIEIITLPTGEEEAYLDQASFERLMFLKRLQLRQAGTVEETVEQLRIPALGERISGAPEPFSLDVSLDRLTREMRELRMAMSEVTLKYRELNRELNHVKVENARLVTENTELRTRQQRLARGIKTVPSLEDPPPEPGKLN
jgi:hypothetical protein